MNGKLSHAHIVSIASADDDTLTTIQRKLKNSAEAMKRALHREVFSLLSFRSRIPWYPPVSPAAIMIIPLFVAPCCASSFFFVYLPFPLFINFFLLRRIYYIFPVYFRLYFAFLSHTQSSIDLKYNHIRKTLISKFLLYNNKMHI